MKYTLTLIALLFALSGKAQVLHYDSVDQKTYVNILPQKVLFSDTINCVRLYVELYSDDLHSCAKVHYELRDSLGVIHISRKLHITGDDYTSWDGSNEYPFEWLSTKLGLTLID